MPALKRVLITCVGSGVGQSVVDSLKHLKGEYHLVGSDQARYVYSLPDCEEFVELPQISHPGYIDALLQTCIDSRIDAVIPGHDLELVLLARSWARFTSAGVWPIVATEPLVRLLRDKRAWSAEFRKHTAAVVASCSIADFRHGRACDGIRFPAIAKPTGGSASAGLKILRTSGDVEGLSEDYVIQPFLFPAQGDPEFAAIHAAVDDGRVVQASEISVQLLYAKDGQLLGRFASRNRLKAGVPVEVVPVDSASVWTAVDEVCEVLGPYEPRGPINLQGRLTDEGLIFFEMNPRFTGITGNRAQFGFNEVSLLVDNFVDGSTRPLRVNLNKVGVRQVACRTWSRDRFEFAGEDTPAARPRSIAVLGGTSWLARHFVAARATGEDPVVVVCREQSLGEASKLYAGFGNVEIVSDQAASLKDCLGWADVLVNFVSGRPPQGTRNIVDAHLYQMRLLDLAESCEVPQIVNISSQSVYGSAAPGAPSELTPVDAAAPYAFSKYVIEESVRSLARRRPSVAAVSLRLARLFGAAPGMRPEEFPHRVVACAVDDTDIEVHRAGSVLDLLDVRDAVRAVSFFVDTTSARHRGDVFNVGSGRPVTVARYVELADRLCRRRYERPLRAMVHASEPESPAGLEIGKAARAGWSPVVPLEDSVEDLFEYFAHAQR